MDDQKTKLTLVDAHNLKRGDVQKRQINSIVAEIIGTIHTDLKNAHFEGKKYIDIELPLVFDISNMGIRDGQRAVWSTVIDILQKKNFNVKIDYTEDYCILRITWLSKEDFQREEQEMEIINSCRFKLRKSEQK